MADGYDSASSPPRQAVADRCILLWMNGGPSHIDTFDPKEALVARGAFPSIATKNPALRIADGLPNVASIADELCVIRGMTSREGNHDRAQTLGRTGYAPTPTVDHPSLGSWVAHARPALSNGLPSFVSLLRPTHGGGFLGPAYDPLLVQTPGGPPTDVAAPPGIGRQRLARRQALLELVEQGPSDSELRAVTATRQQVQQRARALMNSPALDAFDLSKESASRLAAYGDTDFGRACLVAKKLVGAGVPFVQVTLDGWDTHEDHVDRTRALLGELDPAYASLLRDLRDEGTLDRTLVVWMGEFGRKPTMNGRDGRDHHPAAWSAVLAGGGTRRGAVVGETDERGERVVAGATAIPDLLATLCAQLGLDPDAMFSTPAGRPVSITDDGTPSPALLAR